MLICFFFFFFFFFNDTATTEIYTLSLHDALPISRIWAELHEKAFRRLGGSPRVVVLDNLKEGVLSPDIYDPTFNPLYRDVLTHYGAVALACRVHDPDRKGKVESGVGHTKKTPLQGKRFESLEEEIGRASCRERV